MTYLFRLLVAAVFFSSCLPAWATVCGKTYAVKNSYNCGTVAAPNCSGAGGSDSVTSTGTFPGYSATLFSSADAACRSVFGSDGVMVGASDGGCQWHSATAYFQTNFIVTSYSNCPPPPVSPCAGLAGTAPNDVMCNGDRCAFYSADKMARGACMGGSAGVPGCLVGGSLDMATFDSVENLWAVYLVNVKYTGGECNTGGSTPGVGGITDTSAGGTTTVPAPLPPGKCSGTVNGVVVVVNCGTTLTPVDGSTTTHETLPDGTVKDTTVTSTGTTVCTNGSCVTTSTTTTTITASSPGGSVTTSTTTTGGTSTGTASAGEGDGVVGGNLKGTGMGSGAVTWYTRTYSVEPGAYFGTKMAGVTAPLQHISTAFFPTWSDSYEACPQFSIPVNLGISQWNYGSSDTNIPCSVWTVCRWVIIISALFLARALIFGG